MNSQCPGKRALKGLNISIDAFINGYSYKERSQINFIDSLALSQVMKNHAAEINAEIAANEPCDVQLECSL